MKNVLPLLISFSPFSPFTPLLSFSLASPSSSFALHCCAVLFSLSFPVYVTQYHQYSSNNDYYNDNHNRCRNNNYLQVLLLSPNFVGFSYIATQKNPLFPSICFFAYPGIIITKNWWTGWKGDDKVHTTTNKAKHYFLSFSLFSPSTNSLFLNSAWSGQFLVLQKSSTKSHNLLLFLHRQLVSSQTNTSSSNMGRFSFSSPSLQFFSPFAN